MFEKRGIPTRARCTFLLSWHNLAMETKVFFTLLGELFWRPFCKHFLPKDSREVFPACHHAATRSRPALAQMRAWLGCPPGAVAVLEVVPAARRCQSPAAGPGPGGSALGWCSGQALPAANSAWRCNSLNRSHSCVF